ncbi:unnamed protein product [Prunus armeniaca]|uniref:Uncharacterized protein n=1 Tax=Prunus armeniaca TaxID=36596 RepID=A0A6J5TG59_PRUAR|nr:unnamed protein product [Prunus armeniaca]
MKRLMYRYFPNVGGRPLPTSYRRALVQRPPSKLTITPSLVLKTTSLCPFHGMDFINTDRPEMVFVSIPLSVQESVAVLRETTELHEKRLSSLCEF